MTDYQFVRILAHGRITDLSNGFKLENGVPFSIYVRPTDDDEMDNIDILVSCKCLRDKQPVAMPVAFKDWTPAAIVEVAANAINLSKYEVFWGAGDTEN